MVCVILKLSFLKLILVTFGKQSVSIQRSVLFLLFVISNHSFLKLIKTCTGCIRLNTKRFACQRDCQHWNVSCRKWERSFTTRFPYKDFLPLRSGREAVPSWQFYKFGLEKLTGRYGHWKSPFGRISTLCVLAPFGTTRTWIWVVLLIYLKTII